MTLPTQRPLCNVLHTHAGIDFENMNPDADFTMEQRECGKPATYGDRIHAGSEPNTIFCENCYAAINGEGRIDIWPLRPEVIALPAVGDVLHTALYGDVTLVQRLDGYSSIDGWKVMRSNGHHAYLTDSDFNLTPEEVTSIRKVLAEIAERRAKDT